MKTLFQRPDHIADPLYVVTPVFNPVRFRSRWKLWEDFEKMCADAGAILYTVEVAFGERAHAITSADNPRHIQLRTSHELWLKENAINVGVSRMPASAKYIAWIDSDVRFARDDWANETLHRLQHYAAVQMWSQYQDLTTDHELIGTASSFMQRYEEQGFKVKSGPGQSYYYYGGKGYPGAPGLAWAMRRSAFDQLGGLLDVCVLGAGDWYMAHALVGALKSGIVSKKNHPRFRQSIFQWAERAKALRRNIGVVPGLALHYWHGPKSKRKYGTREQILIDTQFNPDVDVRRDWQGLYQLSSRSIPLRDRVRQYFHERNEDQL
jgi:hypothetical protein